MSVIRAPASRQGNAWVSRSGARHTAMISGETVPMRGRLPSASCPAIDPGRRTQSALSVVNCKVRIQIERIVQRERAADKKP